MPAKIYNKLVRDKIPTIVEKEGKKAITKQAKDDKDFLYYLSRKLIEEAKEFAETNDIEELADLLEVIETIAGLHDYSFSQLRAIQKEKRAKRGSFTERLVLEKIIS